jgi:hypothetical protein
MGELIVQIVIQKFTKACIIKGKADEAGDSRKGNKQYKIINATYQELKANKCLNELLPLLEHENLYVRMWASGYLLQITPAIAEKVLEQLSSLRGNIGFCSTITLREWRSGNLVL